jgi:hypothetical protein
VTINLFDGGRVQIRVPVHDPSTGEILEPDDEDMGTEEEVDVTGLEAPDSMAFGAIVRALSQPLEPKYLSIKEVQGVKMPYVSWHVVTAILDRIAVDWDYALEPYQVVPLDIHSGGFVVCRATVIIAGRRRMGQGNAALISKQAGEGKRSYGDPFSNSESMALRRAAAKFGLGRYLYNKARAERAVVEVEAYRRSKATRDDHQEPPYRGTGGRAR